jgi:hypothetical protein
MGVTHVVDSYANAEVCSLQSGQPYVIAKLPARNPPVMVDAS